MLNWIYGSMQGVQVLNYQQDLKF